ncbi:992_t:CDS:2 [Funneliformis geosporum]|nr:992_t:CDS:2 [Funneliformis geosporum]
MRLKKLPTMKFFVKNTKETSLDKPSKVLLQRIRAVDKETIKEVEKALKTLTLKNLNKKTTLYVWVININEKGNSLWFITGQDSSGCIQIVVKNKELISQLKDIKKGDLLKIGGIIKIKKGEKVSKKEAELEIELTKFQLINANSSNKDLPFPFVNVKEDNKYRYRYLDLRNSSSKKLLLIKNKFCYELRNFFHKKGFIDIETPILSQSSPEGAKCFVVPSNLKGRYYTLPQSPQVFKQLLMVGGLGKYYQIAKSFRNEDARSNRQIEFSQLDLELSFTSVKEIKKLVEKFLKTVLKKTFGYQIKTPFLALTYQEVMQKYSTDKPDLRSNPQNEKELNSEWGGNTKRQYPDSPCRITIQALEFAAPPHGGIGLGIDRLLATILQVKSLKELIAFPKNIDGTCSLTGTPDLIADSL